MGARTAQLYTPRLIPFMEFKGHGEMGIRAAWAQGLGIQPLLSHLSIEWVWR